MHESASRTFGRTSVDVGLSREEMLKLFYYMLLMREFETAVLRLYQQGKIIGGAYSGNGNEATAVGSAFALAKEDYLFPMHRDSGAHFVKGQSVRAMMLQQFGKADSHTRGRDGTGHYSDPVLRIYGNISHLGAMLPVACGVALACTLRKQRSVVLTYIGDGGSNVGEVHEGLAMASVMKLPLILVVENNQYAYSTPVTKQIAVKRLADRAAGYGIPGITVDGTDAIEVYRVCSEAVDRARNGRGPTMIESVTMRMHGHAAHDTAWYVPKGLLEEWKQKDPVERFSGLLSERGLLDASKREELTVEIRREVEDAISSAQSSPDPAPEDAARGVYAPTPDSGRGTFRSG